MAGRQFDHAGKRAAAFQFSEVLLPTSSEDTKCQLLVRQAWT